MSKPRFKEERIVYESRLGRLSDAQWGRVLLRLEFEACAKGERLERLEIYLMLRASFPKTYVGLGQIEAVKTSKAELSLSSEISATGKQILRAAMEYGARSTVYRWGYSMGAPLFLEKEYRGKALGVWITRLAIAATGKQKSKKIRRDDHGRFI